MRTTCLIITTLFIANLSLTAQSWWKGGIDGEGPRVERQLDLASFSGIALSLKADVYLTQGSTQSVTVEGQANILDLLNQDIDGRTWKIKTEDPVDDYTKLKITITVPQMTDISISGSGDVYTTNMFSTNGTVELASSGSGDIQFNTNADAIDVAISGSSDIDLEGTANRMEARISGSGDIEAAEFVVNDCEIRVSGSGDVKVHAKEKLDVRVSGSGDVLYYGQPKVYSRISGSGQLSAM